MKSRLYWELLDYGTFVEDEGGFYAGMIKHPDGKIYAILLSPKSEGESNNNGRQAPSQSERLVLYMMDGKILTKMPMILILHFSGLEV